MTKKSNAYGAVHNKDAYGGFAKYYDPCFEPFLGRARAQVAHLCQKVGAQRVLDICCGTGKQMEHYYRLGIDSYGVDMSHGMLNIAKKTAQKVHFNTANMGSAQGNGRKATINVLHADATHLPFPDATFDLASVSLALHEMPLLHAEMLVLEALRVAKQLIIMDYCMAERNIELPATWLAFVVEHIVGGEHYQNYKTFMSQGAVEGLITRLALRRVTRQKVWAGAGVLELVQCR